MALGTTNIDTRLVGNAIGSGSDDYGELCTSPLINKWAKYKPINHPNLFEVSLAERKPIHFGLSIYNYPNIDSLIADINSNSVIWDYNKPTGGISSPYRIADFRNYKHLSEPPFGSFDVPTNAYTNISNPIVNAHMSMALTDDTINSLGMNDFGIKNWYFGAYLIRASGTPTYARWITASNDIEHFGYSVNIPIAGLASGQYYVYPIIAEISRPTLETPESASLFVGFDGIQRKTLNIASSPLYVHINAAWRDQSVFSGYIDYEITIENNSGSSISLQNCFTQLRYGNRTLTDPMLDGESSENHGTLVVPANSTYILNGSHEAFEDPTNGWKLWFVSANPYSIEEYREVFSPILD